MNQKSSLRENPQFVSWVLTGNTLLGPIEGPSATKSNHSSIAVDNDADDAAAALLKAAQMALADAEDGMQCGGVNVGYSPSKEK